jgi:preprotein translocase subunit YajC
MEIIVLLAVFVCLYIVALWVRRKRTPERERLYNVLHRQQRLPVLCGSCGVCVAAGDHRQRLKEYLVNLDDDEPITIDAAADWLVHAYPSCDEEV